jgi:regulator of sigma E protease
MEFVIAPKLIESKNIFGKDVKRPKIGIGYYGDVILLKTDPYGYIKTGIRQTLDNTSLTYRFIWYLITGKVSMKGTVTGPIGIAMILGKAVKIGMVYLIYLVAHINLALAVFNLLPFPVLDGGHILFLGLEKIRRRPLSPKVQEVIQYIAIACLVAFMLLVTYNDIFMLKFLK